MNEQLIQYEINTNWRYHVHRFVEERISVVNKRSKANKSPLSMLEYCGGNVAYANALDQWYEYMKEEERFSFYVHFVSQSLTDAKKSLQLLVERHEDDPIIRMPLLRDSFTCYSRPFKSSYGRLGINYRIEEDVGTPSPRDVHEKVIHDRDRLYAHCDLSVREPRVSKFGISLKGAGFYWNDYVKLLPSIGDVFNSAITLVKEYIKEQGMTDTVEFFKRFENIKGLTDREPKLLNELYGYKATKGINRTC
jgi:hypothetical protein